MIFLGSFMRLRLFILATIFFSLLFLDFFSAYTLSIAMVSHLSFSRLVNTALHFLSLGTLDI
jgi:hypothetical protein